MHSRRDEHGFSLVEVLIAMFLLSVLALALLPLIIGATRLSVVNKDLVAATAFANSQIAILRDDFPLTAANTTSCTVLQSRQVDIASAIADPGGTGMSATVDIVDSCPVDFPASIRVDVVVRDSVGDELVTIPTRFRVSGA